MVLTLTQKINSILNSAVIVIGILLLGIIIILTLPFG
jgi:hypothetical protein